MIGKTNKNIAFLCLLGDIFFFVFALWFALALRYFSLPSIDLLKVHFLPFSFLIISWVFVFFVAGLYERPTISSRKKLPFSVFRAQFINSIVAVFFFYFISIFFITPKTILFLYLLISFLFVLFWRFFVDKKIRETKKYEILIVGENNEIFELAKELEENSIFATKSIKTMDFDGFEKIDFSKENFSTIVLDLNDPKSEKIKFVLHELILKEISIISFEDLYEDVFERIPLSSLNNKWFLKNISLSSKKDYDPIKRLFDFLVALFLCFFSLVFYPFVFLAIWLEDGGDFVIVQDRVGKGGEIKKIFKIRSMNVNDRGSWVKERDERITKVGAFIRKTRIDELPQFFNVLRGDISLVGPRPDIVGIREEAEREIPNYGVRTIVRPGMSGWAQVKQEKPPQSIEETKERLMYDLYYIKNRSLFLDFKIALKTIRILIQRTGS